MKTFLESVTYHLIQTRGLNNLADTTIVVPTRRAMLFVKECFRKYMRANALQGPVQLPQMTSLSQLLDDLSPRYKIDEIQLVCTLYRVYLDTLKQDGANLSLPDFYGWGKQLVQDFSNIDKAFPLVTPQDFLNNTASARKLEYLDIDEDVRERLLALVSLREDNAALAESKRRVFERIWENLPLIYERFLNQLGNYGYEGARMRAVLNNWQEEFIQRKVEGRYFVFAGFNYLVPAEKRLMHLLKDSNQAAFYWDYPAGFTANTKAFRWIIRNAEEFGNAIPVQNWETKPVEVICTASAHAQAQYVNDWLQNVHHPGDRTAVVICDETMLEQVVYALPVDSGNEQQARFQHINITKGFPLRHTDAYAKLLSQLNKEDTMNVDDLMPRLEALPEEQMVQMTWHEMLDFESRFQLRTALVRFNTMLQNGLIPTITDKRTFKLLLRRYLEGITFPFHGEPLADIQVTGVLETRAMDFDNVLLLNVEEGIVPHVGADLSYLPYYLRKAYGLQTREESTDVYAYNFMRLTWRAKNVTMLYTGSESRNNKKTMSRFLRQIMVSKDFRVTKKVLIESNEPASPVIPISNLTNYKNEVNRALAAEKSQTTNDKSQITNNDFFFSPSALNTFRNCQLRFFLQYQLKIHEPEQQSLLLQRTDIGTIVHETMQHIYQNQNSPAAIPEPTAQWLNDQLKNQDLLESHSLESEVIRTFVARIIRADKALASKSNLLILSHEQDAVKTINVPDFGLVRVGGRIDRVDKVDNTIRIVDYKTGMHKPDYDFQINIYREAYKSQYLKGKDENIDAVLYLCKTDSPQATLHEVAYNEGFMGELTALLHEVMTFISNPPEDFTTVMASKSECNNCPYYLLCHNSNNYK